MRCRRVPERFRWRYSLADCSLNFRNGQLFALEVLHHEVLVQLSNVLPQFVVVLLSLLHHVSRDILVADILAEVIVVNLCTHGDEVDDALKVSSEPIGSCTGTALHFRRSFIMPTTL